MIDTNEPLSREELALFYSRMNEEFVARNKDINGLLAKVNNLSNLCNAKIDKVIKAVNSEQNKLSNEEKQNWIAAAENVLDILGESSSCVYILNTIMKLMSIIDMSIDDEILGDSFGALNIVAEDETYRQLFEEIIDFIMRKRYPEKFSLMSYKSEITNNSDLVSNNAHKVIEDDIITPDPETDETDEKANYRGIPQSVKDIIVDYATKCDISFNAATAKLYKTIERKTGNKLAVIKKQYMEQNNIPYCTTAYMISQSDGLFELLKTTAQEL
jgi:hypothetical protein